MLYRIMPMLGGMITPRFGEVVINPMEYSLRIPVLQKRRDHEPAQRHNRGHGRPRKSPQKVRRPAHPAMPRPARQPTDQCIGDLDQLVDDGIRPS